MNRSFLPHLLLLTTFLVVSPSVADTKKPESIPDKMLMLLYCLQDITDDLIAIKTPVTRSVERTTLSAPISAGELIDKITILQIKNKQIDNPEKLKNIRIELNALQETCKQCVPYSKEIEKLTQELLEANKQLWDIEDAIRDKELKKEFDQEFIEIARSVYLQNDERCRVKRMINKAVGSDLIEEKSYKQYNDKNCFDF